MDKKFKKNKNPSILTTTLANKKPEIDKEGNFKVSFQYLDTTQKYGSGYRDWQNDGLLSKALEVLQGYCCSALTSQIDGDKFTIYGDFPPKTHTQFDKPEYISDDAKWARIHVTGAAILAGHVVNDTFYIVFLDKTHKFYLTKRERKKKDQ